VYSGPIILPLDIDGTIYVIQDEHGKEIGTGSRKVCEVLMSVISKRSSNGSEWSCSKIPHRPYVRAAIVI
jgi:hypothetical protein